MLDGKRILLVIAGGIAAYKSLDLIRRLRERGAIVRCILTEAGRQFVTPLSVSTLSHERVFMDMFSLTDEHEIGHIRLARDCDMVLVAPATADLIAKMALGIAGDLASTCLLATDRPILIAPAMNHVMWNHAATCAHVETLAARGVRIVGPEAGELAEGETGIGRMSEPLQIVAAVAAMLDSGKLKGRRALVTSGPTYEPIDPVRFIGNRSSGKQGHAIAAALAELGCATQLVTGPTNLPDPRGVATVHIETAAQMLEACRAQLPVDIAVCAAAVADWRPAARAGQKIKKDGGAAPSIDLTENPDILATLAQAGALRPRLVVGFAAETQNVIDNAQAKRVRKGCDWIVANDVSAASGTFGGDQNLVHIVDGDGIESWPRLGKDEVARRLVERIARGFA
jgi:phosphopantothenoylcysteine decarboxylase / phosphopantothenate---cysteine ligase